MIVECPKCSTRYRFSAVRMKSAVPTLKCSRCGYVFLLPGAKKQPTRRKPRSEEPQEQLALGGLDWKGDDLAHDRPAPKLFADDDTGGDVPGVETAGDETQADEAPAPEPPGRFDDDFEDETNDANDQPPLAFDEEADDDSDLNAAGAAAAADDDEADTAAVEPEPEPEPEPVRRPAARSDSPRTRRRRPPPVPAVPAWRRHSGWFALAGVVLMLYLAVTWTLLARPVLADRVLGALPPFADLRESALLAGHVHLSAVAAEYQRIGDRETAFVLSGFATSAAPHPLRDVQIRGRLFGDSGDVVAEKSIYCGVATTPSVLGDLDTREVTVLQRIQPPPRFAIHPGASSRFLVAFVDPPEDVARYTLEVVSASPIDR